MGKTELKAIQLAIKIHQRAKSNPRGCAEVSAAALGGKVRQHQIKGDDLIKMPDNDEGFRRHKLTIVGQFDQYDTLKPATVRRVLQLPNATNKSFGVPRIPGIRGTLITIDHEQSGDHHMLAVLPNARLGTLGKNLAKNDGHFVADRALFPEHGLGGVDTNSITSYLNTYHEHGATITFRYITRSKHK